MKAAKDRGKDFYDLAKTSFWREHLKDPVAALDKVSKLIVGSRLFVTLAVNDLWLRGLRHGAKDVRHTDVGRCLALFGSAGPACVCAQPPRIGMFQGSTGSMVSSSSLPF